MWPPLRNSSGDDVAKCAFPVETDSGVVLYVRRVSFASFAGLWFAFGTFEEVPGKVNLKLVSRHSYEAT